jgi:hypothetical protein
MLRSAGIEADASGDGDGVDGVGDGEVAALAAGRGAGGWDAELPHAASVAHRAEPAMTEKSRVLRRPMEVPSARPLVWCPRSEVDTAPRG